MKINIPAWRENKYVSLAELLRLLADFYSEKIWSAVVEEVAPEPGSEKLESLDAGAQLTFSELLEMVSPDIQLIDGEITAKDGKGICLLLRAVDSSSWDIETDQNEVIAKIFDLYPEASEIYY